MLLRPAIILDAAPAQRRKRGDGARKVDRLFGRGDAGPRDAGIDVDQHVQRRALGRKRGIDPPRDIGMIDRRHQPVRMRRQRRKPLDRVRRGDRRGNEDAGDAAIGKRLRLADLRAADPGGARRKLALRDIDALVGLGMGPEAHAARGGQPGHRGDIAVERLDIEDEHRRIEVGARALSADEVGVQGQIVTHENSASRCGFRNLPCGSAARRTAR